MKNAFKDFQYLLFATYEFTRMTVIAIFKRTIKLIVYRESMLGTN